MQRMTDQAIKTKIKSDTVPYGELSTVERTMEIDGEPAYAMVHVAPGKILGPYTESQMYQQFGTTGIPRVYFNQLKRISDEQQRKATEEKSGDVIIISGKVLNQDGSFNRKATDDQLKRFGENYRPM